MKHILPLLLLAFAATAPVRAADESASPAPLLRSLFGLRVTAQRVDPIQPWKKGGPERRTGYSLAVGTNLFLTTEQLVRDATLVEVNPAGSARFYPALVLRSDRDLNLALLDVSQAGLPEKHVPLEVTGLPFPGSKGDFVQFEEGGTLQEGSVQILRASMESPAEGSPALLTLEFLADIPLNGQGVPILKNGLLAGLAASYDRATKLGLLYPGRSLKRFIEDAPRRGYQGLALAGLSWKPLPDPAKRRFLKAPEGDRGVQVVSTVEGTDADSIFRSGDVLTAWSGYPIDQQGYYNDPALGRMLFPALISACRPGDAIPFTIFRNGVETQSLVRLAARSALRRQAPEHDSVKPAYLIEGGLVMRDLTGDYLRAAGSEWMLRANARLVHLFLTKGEDDAPNGERFPILAFVLPDTINVGYQEFRDMPIATANGQPVRSLKDILRIREKDGTINRIGLAEMEVELALDAATLPAANARIAAQYRIPRLLVPTSDF
jgi:hypothetical protein